MEDDISFMEETRMQPNLEKNDMITRLESHLKLVSQGQFSGKSIQNESIRLEHVSLDGFTHDIQDGRLEEGIIYSWRTLVDQNCSVPSLLPRLIPASPSPW